MRYEQDKGIQAHTAIHEAGHAVVSIISRGVVPEVIYSSVLNENNSGFNLFDIENNFYTIDNYKDTIATIIAGMAAEEFVFGKDKISACSSSDFNQATTLVMQLLKECGFGEYKGKFTSIKVERKDNYMLEGKSSSLDKKASDILEECYQNALTILEQEEKLLLMIAKYLAKKPKITQKTLIQYVNKYCVSLKYNDIKKNKNSFFLDTLNAKIDNLNK